MLISLALIDNLSQGFHTILEIGKEGERPDIVIEERLPANSSLIEAARTHWENYRNLNEELGWRTLNRDRNRGIVIQTVQVGSINQISKCKKSEEALRTNFNQWLKSSSFQSSREQILPRIKETDTVRFLIKTNDPELKKLPWEDWDFLKQYGDRAGVAFGFETYQRCDRKQIAIQNKIRILAVFGNSEGIDTQSDRDILKNLKSQFPQKIELKIPQCYI
jgi:hypothetical protein